MLQEGSKVICPFPEYMPTLAKSVKTSSQTIHPLEETLFLLKSNKDEY